MCDPDLIIYKDVIYKNWKQHVVNLSRPKRFYWFTLRRKAQSWKFESSGCIITWTVNELYDQRYINELSKEITKFVNVNLPEGVEIKVSL